MKEYTPIRATKELCFLADEKRRLLDIERENFVCFADEHGKLEDDGSEYNYARTRSKVAELDRKTAILRHALHDFNGQAILPGSGITIDEASIQLSLMGKEKQRLAALRNVPRKRRVETGFILQGPRYEYECANFDPDKVERDYLNLCASMRDLQLEIGVANNTLTFTVDI